MISLDFSKSFATIDAAYPILKSWSQLLPEKKSSIYCEKVDSGLLLKIANEALEVTVVKIKTIEGRHKFDFGFDYSPVGTQTMKDYIIETTGEDIEGKHFKFSAEASFNTYHGRSFDVGGSNFSHGMCTFVWV